MPTPGKRIKAAVLTRSGIRRAICGASVVIVLDTSVAMPEIIKTARFPDTSVVKADLTGRTGPTASTAVLSVTGRIYTCAVTACFTRRTTGILTTEEAVVADKAARPIGAGRYGIGPKGARVPTGAAVLRVGAQIIAGGTAKGEPRGTAADTVGLSSGCDDP